VAQERLTVLISLQELLALPASEETLTQIDKDLPRTMGHTGLMKPGAQVHRPPCWRP